MSVSVTGADAHFGTSTIKFEVKPPRSKAGHSVDLRAEIDLIVTLLIARPVVETTIAVRQLRYVSTLERPVSYREL